jgi:hypothetical protein
MISWDRFLLLLPLSHYLWWLTTYRSPSVKKLETKAILMRSEEFCISSLRRDSTSFSTKSINICNAGVTMPLPQSWLTKFLWNSALTTLRFSLKSRTVWRDTSVWKAKTTLLILRKGPRGLNLMDRLIQTIFSQKCCLRVAASELTT